MKVELINAGLAFFEGFILIVSPCILPILPIILSTSVTGGRRRPLGVITGFIISFALFTLFSRKLVQLLNLDLDIIRKVSFVLLFLFGIIIISDKLTEMFDFLTQRLANLTAGKSQTEQKREGFISGVLFGGVIGLVWTPCAGPILAAVILQTVLQQTDVNSIITILLFSIGIAVPMLAIVFFGRSIIIKFSFLRERASYLRKVLGIAVIASVLYMSYGYYVSFSFGTGGGSKVTNLGTTLVEKVNKPYPAPPISNIEAWINSAPLQISQLKGKVVLIDFWAYSCINCVRTLPYLIDLYSKYHDKGLEIIGVHSPEFDFESKYANIQNAVKKYGIKYPVALDNNFSTWQNFNNHYWPAHYLLDKNGYVVYQHFGEGSYDILEHNIRILLGIASSPMKPQKEQAEFAQQTPETYLGYEREMAYIGVERLESDKAHLYSYPNSIAENGWALQGKWLIEGQKITALEPNAAIKINFIAGKVYAVMGNNSKEPLNVKLLLNGKPVVDSDGKKNREITVANYALYTLLSFPKATKGELELIASSSGLEIYTFTFGP